MLIRLEPYYKLTKAFRASSIARIFASIVNGKALLTSCY